MARVTALGVLVMALCGCAQRDSVRWTPAQIALVNPVQAAPDGWDVYGLRLDLVAGKNRNVYGLDAGLVNHATGDMVGIQTGVFVSLAQSAKGFQHGGINATSGDMAGLQVAGGLAFAPAFAGTGNLSGVQLAGIIGMSSAKEVNGLQAGVIFNLADDLRGAQVAAFGNIAFREASGMQIGALYNWTTGPVRGLQLALLNRADNLSGLQVGLVNIHKHGILPFFPGINVGFGGKPPSEPDRTTSPAEPQSEGDASLTK